MRKSNLQEHGDQLFNQLKIAVNKMHPPTATAPTLGSAVGTTTAGTGTVAAVAGTVAAVAAVATAAAACACGTFEDP